MLASSSTSPAAGRTAPRADLNQLAIAVYAAGKSGDHVRWRRLEAQLTDSIEAAAVAAKRAADRVRKHDPREAKLILARAAKREHKLEVRSQDGKCTECFRRQGRKALLTCEKCVVAAVRRRKKNKKKATRQVVRRYEVFV